MTDAPVDPSNPCGGCGARCCKGEVIWLMPERGDVLDNYTRMPGINPLTGRPGFFIPQTPVTKHCVYLGEDDRCTVYDHRPVVCRHFTCWEAYDLTPRPERRRRVRQGVGNPAIYERGKHVLIAMGRRPGNDDR